MPWCASLGELTSDVYSPAGWVGVCMNGLMKRARIIPNSIISHNDDRVSRVRRLLLAKVCQHCQVMQPSTATVWEISLMSRQLQCGERKKATACFVRLRWKCVGALRVRVVCRIDKFVGWCFMGVVITTEMTGATSGGLRLQCIAIPTFSNVFVTKWKLVDTLSWHATGAMYMHMYVHGSTANVNPSTRPNPFKCHVVENDRTIIHSVFCCECFWVGPQMSPSSLTPWHSREVAVAGREAWLSTVLFPRDWLCKHFLVIVAAVLATRIRVVLLHIPAAESFDCWNARQLCLCRGFSVYLWYLSKLRSLFSCTFIYVHAFTTDFRYLSVLFIEQLSTRV